MRGSKSRFGGLGFRIFRIGVVRNVCYELSFVEIVIRPVIYRQVSMLMLRVPDNSTKPRTLKL